MILKQLIGKWEIVVIKVCGMHQICFLQVLNLLDILQIHDICPGCPGLKCSKEDVSTALISNMYFMYYGGGGLLPLPTLIVKDMPPLGDHGGNTKR